MTWTNKKRTMKAKCNERTEKDRYIKTVDQWSWHEQAGRERSKVSEMDTQG